MNRGVLVGVAKDVFDLMRILEDNVPDTATLSIDGDGPSCNVEVWYDYDTNTCTLI